MENIVCSNVCLATRRLQQPTQQPITDQDQCTPGAGMICMHVQLCTAVWLQVEMRNVSAVR